MEAEKFSQSAICKPEIQESWRCNLIQVWRSENRRADDVDYTIWICRPENQEHWEQKIGIPPQAIRQEKLNSFILCLLVLFSPLWDWIMPTHIGEDEPLYWVYRFQC